MMIALKYQNSSNCCIVLFLSPFSPLFRGESPTLYSPFWIIFTLHLLIIWTFTWVLVPSATFPTSLWVALAKEALYRRLLHINVASKVAVVHLMRWCQSSLRYFQVFLLFSRPWNTFLSLNLLRRSLKLLCYIFWTILIKSEEYVLLGRPYICSLLMEFGIRVFHHYLLILEPIFISLDKAQGLIYDPGPLPLRQPTVEPLQYPTELDIVVAFFPLLHKSPICD